MTNGDPGRRAFVATTLGIALAGCTFTGIEQDSQEDDAGGQEEATEQPQGQQDPQGRSQEPGGQSEEPESDSSEDTTHSVVIHLRRSSGAPVDAEVTVIGPAGRSLYDSSDGRVVLELPTGEYTFSAADFEEGYGSNERTFQVTDDMEVTLTLVEMIVEEVVAVAGPYQAAAVSGVEITLERRDGGTTTRTTDHTGTVMFDVYRGRYRLIAVGRGKRQIKEVYVDGPGMVVEFDRFGP